MNQKHIHPSRLMRGIVIASVMLVAGLSSSYVAAEAHPYLQQERAMNCQNWLKEKLDQSAQRLELKASQQNAWQAYAATVQALGSGPDNEPGKTADAATIARFHADRAGEFAGKLKKIAGATAKLQSVLTADQRKTFDQIVRLAGLHEGSLHEHEEMMPGREGMMGDGDREHCQHHDENRSEAPSPPAP